MGMKTCTRCGETKPLDAFIKAPRRADGRGSHCRTCHNEQVRANKAYRRVWHECTLCGDDRIIDRRNVRPDLICDKCQRDNVRERNNVRWFLTRPAIRERDALERARRYGRSHLRTIEVSWKRQIRANQWLAVLRPRVCSCGAVFNTASWTRIYCDVCKPARGKLGNWISKARRVALYERDGWLCFCGDPVIPWGSSDNPFDPLYATLDHIQPRSLGGSDDDGNLRTAHFGCNSERGADPDWELELSAA